ncbi:substrate-binding periplasmic protein [Shewanella maritima]|uniref:substrate-binding periplasmic protein n=1 Tax=Shewanella maritima TaxID=2520507 RepID=UPI003736F8F6
MKYWVIAIIWLISFVAEANDFRIVTVNEAPANYINGQGKIDGYVTDVVQALQQIIGDETVIEVMPEARALYTAKAQNNVLLYSFSKTDQRNKNYHFIQKVLSKPWFIFTHRDSNLRIGSLEALHQLESIGVVIGDIRAIWLEQQGFQNLQYSVTHEQNLKMLQAGRVSAIASEQLAVSIVAMDLGFEPDEFSSQYQFEQSDVYIMMSQACDDILVAQWRDAAKQLVESGELLQIALQWQYRIQHQYGLYVDLIDDILHF